LDPFRRKLGGIRLLVLDADGVLTDGRLFWGPGGEIGQSFHVRDGYGLKRLLESGVEVAVISGRRSEALASRMHELGIARLFQGATEKGAVLRALQHQLQRTREETAALGDDEPDLALFAEAGVTLAVADAHPALRNAAEYVTRACGGNGAVREIVDLLLASRGRA
jgi:3-deoxy-D-manno-octulosonate 8-phosphate phosphatase (KDO 8-P phosphatase)